MCKSFLTSWWSEMQALHQYDVFECKSFLTSWWATGFLIHIWMCIRTQEKSTRDWTELNKIANLSLCTELNRTDTIFGSYMKQVEYTVLTIFWILNSFTGSFPKASTGGIQSYFILPESLTKSGWTKQNFLPVIWIYYYLLTTPNRTETHDPNLNNITTWMRSSRMKMMALCNIGIT